METPKLWRFFAVNLLVGYVSYAFWDINPRVLGFLALAAAIVACAAFPWHRKRRLVARLWVLFWVMSFVPVDVSLRNYEGPPRFMPLLMGYPTPESKEKIRNGEMAWGGCVTTGLEPWWIWVW